MKTAVLLRTYNNHNTTGCFIFDDDKGNPVTLGSLELPWKNNEPQVSCIPEGVYAVKKTFSPRFKKSLYLVCDVPNRTGIRIHPANYASDTEKNELLGCIALCLALEDINGDGIIDGTSSKIAVAMAESSLGDTFKLTIRS